MELHLAIQEPKTVDLAIIEHHGAFQNGIFVDRWARNGAHEQTRSGAVGNTEEGGIDESKDGACGDV